MRRLIRADLHNLFKDKTFLIISVFSFVLGVFMPLMGFKNKIMYDEITVFEDGFFIFLSVFALLIPTSVSFFVGKSFDWGTLRNKICVGHSRINVYFSFLITCFIGTTILIALYFIPYLVLGSFMLEAMDIPLKAFILFLLTSILVLFSLTALSVAIVENIESRVVSMAITMVVVIALLMVGTIAVQMLMEPEMITNSMTMMDGEFVFADPYPNPRYVKESQRWIWELMRDSILGGQIHQITALECNWVGVSLYSVISGIICSFIGYILFNRKDLK